MAEVLNLKEVSLSKKIYKKKKFGFSKIIKFSLVIVFSVVLTTLGIKATDNLFFASLKESSEIKPKANEGPCPLDMVFVASEKGGFCIDKYENSPGPKCSFLNPQNQKESQDNLSNPDCYPVSKAGLLPWTNISQNQAQLACAKAGKRLPTAKEWYLAALGTPDKSNDWTKDDCHLNKNWGKEPGLTGSGKNCQSSAGAFDMAGNVWEWVADTIFDGNFQNRPLPNQGYVWGVEENGFPFQTEKDNPSLDYNQDYFWIYPEGTRAIARGGYFQSETDGGIYSSYLVALPSNSSLATGFRCAK